MGQSEIISIITLAAVIIGAIVNLSNMVGKSATKAAANAKTEIMLQNIYTKVDRIERKQDNIEATIQQHGERITKVEESAKSAHHRIDGIKGGGEQNG